MGKSLSGFDDPSPMMILTFWHLQWLQSARHIALLKLAHSLASNIGGEHLVITVAVNRHLVPGVHADGGEVAGCKRLHANRTQRPRVIRRAFVRPELNGDLANVEHMGQMSRAADVTVQCGYFTITLRADNRPAKRTLSTSRYLGGFPKMAGKPRLNASLHRRSDEFPQLPTKSS